MDAHAILPGSFDPPTLGHLDLFRRSAGLFSRVTVAVADHATKDSLLTVDERLGLLETLTGDLDNVRVARVEGLLVHACRDLQAGVVVRGVRNGTDLDYELSMARTNRALFPEVETVFLAPAPEVSHISSTLVRQITRLGGDVRALVPEVVAELLERRDD